MKINIARLRREQEKTFEFKLEENWSPLTIGSEQVNFSEPVKLAVSLSYVERAYQAAGKVATTVELNCSCCLESFQLPLTNDFQAEFRGVGQVPEPDAEDEGIYWFEGDEIDFQPIVSESIVLSLPMKFVCRSDCRGLCACCGQNLNLGQCQGHQEEIDPRLGVLRTLLDQKDLKGV